METKEINDTYCGLRMPETLHDRVKEQARKERRSVSQIIRLVLEDHYGIVDDDD